MSKGLIAFVGVIYAIIAIDRYLKDDFPMGIVFFSYALSNIGLFWAAK